jgi:hypothetical protein
MATSTTGMAFRQIDDLSVLRRGCRSLHAVLGADSAPNTGPNIGPMWAELARSQGARRRSAAGRLWLLRHRVVTANDDSTQRPSPRPRR